MALLAVKIFAFPRILFFIYCGSMTKSVRDFPCFSNLFQGRNFLSSKPDFSINPIDKVQNCATIMGILWLTTIKLSYI